MPSSLLQADDRDKHFYLSSESSYQEGRWTTAPFQVAILNAMGNDLIREVNFVKSARLGYTKMLMAFIGYLVQHKKRNVLMYCPTEGDAEGVMKRHIEGMIRDVPVVLDLAPWYGMKHRDNTLEAKCFANRKMLWCLGGNAGRNAGVFVPVLNAAMGKFGIVTRLRMAAFIAQVGHESGQLRYVRELGNDAYLAKYDTGPLAKRLGNTPEADGDGQKYRGRGLIQITGLSNYRRCGEALGLDLVNRPELLEQSEHAAMSAAWFWHQAGLNPLADRGEFNAITRRINGGLNGLDGRLALWEKARKVLGV